MVLREQAEHMDAPDRCSSLYKSSCAAGGVHTWTYNDRSIAQLRWCRGRPRHHVTGHLLRRPGGDREMVEILSLVLHHDEQAVLHAVELALEAGVATKTHVLNVLHRLIDGKAPPAGST